ncbi:aminopeptidase [Dyadobacter fermentans DSM 18053]|uniref:Aminopeptidase n=1 Tax=Dyadobacter fermentans (strain ATCC 700827 / DSM 18053 / CIP 107007 / KCTC 52180 / NS114) TaxID=471854 RepID=C6VUG7_DYAFD|nr:aminopeptidase [Dyadobacter fermentans DSM 18053]
MLALLVIVVLLGVWQREVLTYAFLQAKGQIGILMQVEDVPDVLSDESFPDSLKARIRLIQEIKKFGVDSLGLTPSDNYTTFYNQHGRPLIWLITASERYKVQPHQWHFPIVGTFPYKGYFDSTRAVAEEKALIDKGLDTDIGEVSAWSTLGYLKDPILSSMLRRRDGSLANLILHELTHGTLFVKNNLELNENLASFVGDQGAIRFLKYKYGAESEQMRQYEYSKRYNDAYSQHMLRGAGRLDSLYKTFGPDPTPDAHRDSLKTKLITDIVNDTDTLLSGKRTLTNKSRWPDGKLPNNAYFISYLTYKSKQDTFRQEFEQKFGKDLKKYLNYLKGKYPSL